jgi:hypothetical protein
MRATGHFGLLDGLGGFHRVDDSPSSQLKYQSLSAEHLLQHAYVDQASWWRCDFGKVGFFGYQP